MSTTGNTRVVLHPKLEENIHPAVALLGALGIATQVGRRPDGPLYNTGIHSTLRGRHGPDFPIAVPRMARQLAQLTDAERTGFLRPAMVDVVVMSWKMLENEAKADSNHSPTVQFLRHIRNGCAHGNRFDIRGKDPIKLAEWKGVQITKALNGTPVLYTFLDAGDVFTLLNDVFWELLP